MDNLNKSDVLAVRIAFAALLGAVCAYSRPFQLSPLAAFGAGTLGGAIVIGLELRLRQVSLKQLVGGTVGMLVGTVLGISLVALFAFGSPSLSPSGPLLHLAVPLCFSYVGLLVGSAKSEILNLSAIRMFNPETGRTQSMKLLDTSVIIDGRIADVAEAGFIEGTLVIPQFVLKELQGIADSADSTRRNRGRRGLDVIQRLQKMAHVTVRLTDEEAPSVREVDLKLLELAKIHRCPVVTNDFNLNKVAQVHGVEVLNINELANAVRPVVLPGETMRVFILKEGKEHNQGVAYLNDGTMVVVDHAKKHISKTIEVTVTSVLQTTAGKMIFGKYDERGPHAAAGAPERQSAAPAGTGIAPATAGKESQLV